MHNPADLSTWTVIVRIAASCLLGAAIGLEREVDGHEAGVRTHALLALGAGLLGAVSVGAFGSFVAVRAETNVQVDVTRVASYVAAGIGFLGGGVVLKRADHVFGLTTAASLWVAAAVGLAAGLGFWAGAVATTVVALLALAADRPLRSLRSHLAGGRRMLVVELADASSTDEVLAAIVEELGDAAGFTLHDASDETHRRVRVECAARERARLQRCGATLLARGDATAVDWHR